MSNRNWTDDQKKAITLSQASDGKSCNILVGAAAGSGKTAVLVERIINKIIPRNGKSQSSIDRLLVVTFTNAAAGEMKERLSKALSDSLQTATAEKNHEYCQIIKRQQLLLPSADITTIDAFCLKLLKRYFNLLNIDPAFSIADEAQAEIISDEVISDLFSKLYEDEDKEFLLLLDLFASSRSDEPLARLIKYIYNFLHSVPNPMDWLHEKTENMLVPCEETDWYQYARKNAEGNISYAMSLVKKGLSKICETAISDEFIQNNPPQAGVEIFDEWKSYYKAFHSEYVFFKELASLNPSDAKNLVSGFTFPRFSALKSKPDAERETLKDIHSSVKEVFTKIKSFYEISDEILKKQTTDMLYPAMLGLVHLVEKYHRAFMEKKLSRNILEFSDVEQLAHELLSKNPEIREELSSSYDEILMDEYQDTNGLQEAIFSYITNGENLFTVGDMKQSIYRFRSSDPTIFKSKSDLYSFSEGEKNRKIVLSKNFRSRSEVLESINDIFSQIMTETAGELEYDSQQRLYTGNTSYCQVNDDYKSRCVIIKAPPSELADDEDISRPELEARYISQEIQRLKSQHFKILDNGKYRNIENRDIVILMSSYKNVADIFTAELNDAGIDCFAESQGYFEKNEILLVLALLKIINNPLRDIPLIGVMRSPIGGFSDDELAFIRRLEKGKFYKAVKCAALKADDTQNEHYSIYKKCYEFNEKLKRWRDYSRFMPSDKLLWTLYEETDFYAFVGAMYNGEEAQANLRLLSERAKQYEKAGFQGLFNFVKYIENLKEKDTDLSSAKLATEGHNVVRIMTIHKSKGLEFPVVFVAGINKRFRKGGTESRILLHRRYGIGMDYIDAENEFRCETPTKSVLKSISDAEEISEEIRKLYVATTRAKELLYTVGSVNGKTERGENSELLRLKRLTQDSRCEITPQDVLMSKSYADWLVPVSITSSNWHFDEINYDELSQIKKAQEKTSAQQEEIDIDKIMDFSYPFKDVCDIPTKVSASDIHNSQSTTLITKPKFMEDSTQNGANYGTLIHLLMQHITPRKDMDEEYIKDSIYELVNKKIITEKDAKTVKCDKILQFYHSELGKRLLNSPKVVKEQAFEVEIPAKMVYPETQSDEPVLLQGVIDCWFLEDDQIVLIDFKTDSFKDKTEIRQKYDTQLKLYSYALSKILKKSVKEEIIYLFFDNSVV